MAKMKAKATSPKTLGPEAKPTKSTQAEVDGRVSLIQRELTEGHTRAYILQYASEWGVTERMVDEYIARATRAIRELNKVSIQENMAIITAQLWESFRRGRRSMDEPHCLKVLTQLSKIKGLEKTSLILEDNRELADLSDEELEAAWSATAEDDEEYDT